MKNELLYPLDCKKCTHLYSVVDLPYKVVVVVILFVYQWSEQVNSLII